MTTKMVLIPIDRLRALEAGTSTLQRSITTDVHPIETSQHPHIQKTTQPTSSPDIELKMMREKRLRKRKTPVTQIKSPAIRPLDEYKYRGKRKQRASDFFDHLKKNKDRISYKNNELQFDGVNVGDSNIHHLTEALIDDHRHDDVTGWNNLMGALEATAAPASIYKRWGKTIKEGDWAALQS